MTLGLSNIEINKKLKNIKYFRGVFCIGNLHKKILKNESGVINLDKCYNSGTHWVAYFNSDKSKYVEYFDSFGKKPTIEILKYLKTSKKEIIYNSNQLQENNSIKCGFYCINYILERSKNISMYDVIYKFKQFPSKFNEMKVN